MTAIQSASENKSDKYLVTTIVGSNRWKVNSYLITSTKSAEAFLVDAGGEGPEFLAALDPLCKKLRFILLTHGHFDHLSSASAVCGTYGLPCIVHSGDFKLARHAPFYAIRFDGSALIAPKPLLSLQDSAPQFISEWNITVVETPGHTAGSCCFIIDKFVFTGDTLIREAIGRTDQPGGDSEAIAKSVTNLLKVAPDDGIIFPGHGRPWPVAEARSWWEECGDIPPQHDTFLDEAP